MATHIEQVGGDHYEAPYQHWDYAAETGLGYLEGNASKYLTRHRRKNGLVDLEKARSYVRKLQVIPGVTPARDRPGYSPSKLARFLKAAGLWDTADGALITAIDSWRNEQDLAQLDWDLTELIDHGRR